MLYKYSLASLLHCIVLYYTVLYFLCKRYITSLILSVSKMIDNPYCFPLLPHSLPPTSHTHLLLVAVANCLFNNIQIDTFQVLKNNGLT